MRWESLRRILFFVDSVVGAGRDLSFRYPIGDFSVCEREKRGEGGSGDQHISTSASASACRPRDCQIRTTMGTYMQQIALRLMLAISGIQHPQGRLKWVGVLQLLLFSFEQLVGGCRLYEVILHAGRHYCCIKQSTAVQQSRERLPLLHVY